MLGAERTNDFAVGVNLHLHVVSLRGCLGRMILQYVCFHFLSLITRVVFFVGCLGYVILHDVRLHFLAIVDIPVLRVLRRLNL